MKIFVRGMAYVVADFMIVVGVLLVIACALAVIPVVLPALVLLGLGGKVKNVLEEAEWAIDS